MDELHPDLIAEDAPSSPLLDEPIGPFDWGPFDRHAFGDGDGDGDGDGAMLGSPLTSWLAIVVGAVLLVVGVALTIAT